MMARRGVLAGLIGAAITAVGGCGLSGASRYRFRMTIEADTPQGPRTGSSVYEVTAYKLVKLTSEEKEGSGGLAGQATIIELPHGPMFALLKTRTAGEGLDTAATLALRPDAETGHVADYIAAVRSLGGEDGAVAELPRAKWPILVRFANPSDPSSVEQVDPETVGIKRIRVETTRDNVTTGIERRLAWLTADGQTLDPGGHIDFSGHAPLAKRLRQRDFKAGNWPQIRHLRE